jgi:virginiamycin B lyase
MIVIIVVLIMLLAVGSLIFFLMYSNSSQANPFVSRPQISMYMTEYPTRASTTSPNGIAVDAEGDVWFALWNLSSIAELIPSNGTTHLFHVPGLRDGSMITWSLAIDNSRKLVWFSELTTNSIWAFNMTSHNFTQYNLTTANAFPFGVALDQNHDLWFTELVGNKIGEITPQGSIIELPIPGSGYMEPSGITVDPSGKVWFTLAGTDSIGSYYDGSFTIKNLTGVISTPVGIAVDQQGNVWFTQHGPSFISEYNPTNDSLETISTSNNSLVSSLPYFIHVDQNGNIWFNEHQGNAMSEFIPSSNTLIEYFIPTEVAGAGNISYALTSALSGNGQPWYTEMLSGKVGTVNTSKSLNVNLSVLNYTQSVARVANSTEFSLGLSVNTISQPVSLHAYIGNFSNEGNFTFAFSPATGSGSFNSTVTIHNDGALPGVYFFTITARTTALAVSKIVEVSVP